MIHEKSPTKEQANEIKIKASPSGTPESSKKQNVAIKLPLFVLLLFRGEGGGSRQEGRKAWKKKRGVSRMEAIVYDNSWPLAARRDALVGVVSRETTEWRAYLRKRRNQ